MAVSNLPACLQQVGGLRGQNRGPTRKGGGSLAKRVDKTGLLWECLVALRSLLVKRQ